MEESTLQRKLPQYEILDTPIYMTRKMAIVTMSFGEFGGHAMAEKSFKSKPFTTAPTPFCV